MPRWVFRGTDGSKKSSASDLLVGLQLVIGSVTRG